VPDAAWTPAFACGDSVPRDGIYRFLSDKRLEELEPALAQYRLVRQRDGYRGRDPTYYRALPFVDRHDPDVLVWRVRRQSFRSLCHGIMRAPSLRVLELGAGNCWLTNRLAQFGHRCVALDLLDDPEDALGAARHYETRFTRVQADFDALPLAPNQFDVVIFNASLHYSPNPAATLRHAGKALAPGGTTVVMDSPVFATESDGLRMLSDRRRRFAEYLDAPIGWGVGFLTIDLLERAASESNVSVRRVASAGGLRWAVKRWIAGQKLGRQPATFGIWAFASGRS
jgi:SAM-dependent methyltransferase